MDTEYRDYMRPPKDIIAITSNGDVDITNYGTANVNVQPSLQTKSVTYTTNGTNTVTKDGGYYGMSSVRVTVNVPSANLQTKSTTVSSNGTSVISPDSGYDGLSQVTVTVSVPEATTQAYIGYADCTSSTLSSTAVKLTVSASGTYTVSWLGCRNYSSGTFGSQLYIGSSAYGSKNTSFTGTYFQSNKLTGVSLTAGQTITVYAQSRSSSYHMYVGNLIIEKTS